MSKEWDRNLKFGRKLERHIILVLHVSVKSPIYKTASAFFQLK